MEGSYLKSEVKCPFFRKDKGKSIICEGIVPHSGIGMSFQNSKAFERQMSNYCCDKYSRCILYRAIWQNKYRD